jgi:uncharacterized protein YggE
MKPLLIALMVAMPVVATTAETETPRVVAFGTAVTQVKPDMLRWSLTVSNKGAELSSVSEIHLSRTEAVLRLLGQKRARPDETQTSGMRFSENRVWRHSEHVMDGYLATTKVSFTMRKLEDYRDTWIELSRLDGVSVTGVIWDVTNRIKIQNETRAKALTEARAKAEKMAATLGSKIAEPIVIEEVQGEPSWNQNNMTNARTVAERSDEPGETIAPGSVDIRVKVRVVYRLMAR